MLAASAIAAGILTITFRGFTVDLSLQTGDVLILLATMMYAAGSIIFRRYLTSIVPQLALVARSMMGILAFFLASPFMPHPFIEDLSNFSLAVLPALIGFAFLSRFLNSFSFYEALERLPVSTVSLFGSLEIVLGSIFAYVYLNEPLYWYHIFGGALILLGTVLLEVFVPVTAEEHLEQKINERMHKP